MRRGEVKGLQWSDIDLETGLLSVRRSIEQMKEIVRFKAPKTARGRRVISLPETLVRELIRHKAAQAAHRLQYGPADQDAARHIDANLKKAVGEG